MPRLYLFAEGQTEQTFADTVLKEHLAGFEIWLARPPLVAHKKKGGKVHRGGALNYEAMKADILRFFKQEKGDDVFFTTMIDLYAISTKFPGLSETEHLRHQPEKRVIALEESFLKDLGESRIVPYIQLHEFEALLFSDPSAFAAFFPDRENEIRALLSIAKRTPPEEIDDGRETAPSKRILSHIPDYDKVVDGLQIAQRIGLPTLRSKCPHFDAWVTKLEALGAKTE